MTSLDYVFHETFYLVSAYQPTYYDDVDSNFPVITLEVLSTDSDHNYSTNYEQEFNEEHMQENVDCDKQDTGVHFLSEQINNECDKSAFRDCNENTKETPTIRSDLLEYMTRSDGRVVCKLCGEVLPSRTHWYRHKYKVHTVQSLNPSPLFQCEQCRVYFKSRKGYIGHIASRHSEVLSDSSPVLSNSQMESSPATPVIQTSSETRDETDPETSIPKTSVPNYQTNTPPTKSANNKTENKKSYRYNSRGDTSIRTASEWEEKRIREEKLVADIIARVRKECEAQGDGPTRRGYSRRTTVMHT